MPARVLRDIVQRPIEEQREFVRGLRDDDQQDFFGNLFFDRRRRVQRRDNWVFVIQMAGRLFPARQADRYIRMVRTILREEFQEVDSDFGSDATMVSDSETDGSDRGDDVDAGEDDGMGGRMGAERLGR